MGALRVPSWAAGMARAARAALSEVEAFALPQRCPACAEAAAPQRLLCDRCWERVPRMEGALCARCLMREAADPSSCCSHPGHRVWAAWVYEERAALLVQALKFESRRGLAPALAGLVADALPIDYRPDLVVEVPLHPTRLRERGYNQAGLLADALAVLLKAPRLERAIARVRPTPPQSGLSARARRRNLEGAFALVRPEALHGRKVLIVDDVVTTGSTLAACLEVLHRCGARAAAAALAWST